MSRKELRAPTYIIWYSITAFICITRSHGRAVVKRLWRTTNFTREPEKPSKGCCTKCDASQREACQTVRRTIHSNDCSFAARPQGLSPSLPPSRRFRALFFFRSLRICMYIHFPSGFLVFIFHFANRDRFHSPLLHPPGAFRLGRSRLYHFLECFSIIRGEKNLGLAVLLIYDPSCIYSNGDPVRKRNLQPGSFKKLLHINSNTILFPSLPRSSVNEARITILGQFVSPGKIGVGGYYSIRYSISVLLIKLSYTRSAALLLANTLNVQLIDPGC